MPPLALQACAVRALAARTAGAGAAAARVQRRAVVVLAASSAQRRPFAVRAPRASLSGTALAPRASRTPQPRVAAATADSASDNGAATTPPLPPFDVVPWRKEAANGVTLIGNVGAIDILTFATGVRATISVAVKHKRAPPAAVGGDAASKNAPATQPGTDWCAHRRWHWRVRCVRRLAPVQKY